jgi:hypothetical protein
MIHGAKCQAIAIACLVLLRTQCADASGTDDYVIAFKRFLSGGPSEYEVQFSVVQHADDELKRRLQEFNKRSEERKISISFEQPQFYNVRRALHGFSVRRGSSLADVQGPDTIEYGVVSNTYWSANRQVEALDDAALPKLKATQGQDWTSLADEAVQNVMTLGLWVRAGSVVWNGTKFTAETPNNHPIPRDRRGMRIVSGQLFCTNDIPAMIDYGYDSNRYFVYYHYDGGTDQSTKLPRTMEIIEAYLASGMTNRYSLELIRYRAKDFSVSATGPPHRENELPVFHRDSGGAVSWSGLHGQGSKAAAVKKKAHTGIIRGVIAGSMVICTILIFGRLFWPARPSPRKGVGQ